MVKEGKADTLLRALMAIRNAVAALAFNQATHKFDECVYVLTATPLPLGEFRHDAAQVRGLLRVTGDLLRVTGDNVAQLIQLLLGSLLGRDESAALLVGLRALGLESYLEISPSF